MVSLYRKERRTVHPIFEDDEVGASRRLHGDIAMIMAKDETVHLVTLLEFGSKLIKRLLLTLEDIFFMAGEPVFL